MAKRSPVALVVVLDAVGLSTLEYLLDNYKGKPRFPNLARLGLADVMPGRLRARLAGRKVPGSYAARVRQVSATADSLVGHREMMGVLDDRTYDLFENGFAADYLAELERRIGRKTFYNKMAGGMEAIELNAGKHERTGMPIAYASKCDPLIQLAMNEAVIPVAEQHRIADTAFALAMEMGVPITRAIARSYVRGAGGEIIRTSNRHDAVLPIGRATLVELLRESDVWTCAVGKTSDLVNVAYDEKIKLNRSAFLDPKLGLRFVHPKRKDTNLYSVQGTVNALDAAKSVYRPKGTFIFANLVDTDSVYGHTRDVAGAVKCVEEFDRTLPLLEKRLGKGDLLVITADHGMEHRADYGYHSNEPLPLLAARAGSPKGLGLKTGGSPGLTEVGHLVSQIFGVEKKFLSMVGEQKK